MKIAKLHHAERVPKYVVHRNSELRRKFHVIER